MEGNVKLVTSSEAASSQVLMLFLPRENLETSLLALPDLTGKLILHTNNQICNSYSFLIDSFEKSTSQIVSTHLPTAYIAKVFNRLDLFEIENKKNYDNNYILFSVKTPKAKNKVTKFLESLNFSWNEIKRICF